MKHDVVLLLTGTVNPTDTSFVMLTDPGKRKTQYIDAIRWWLLQTALPIVFSENSGADLSEYFEPEIASGRLEIFSFTSNTYAKEKGKGLGELYCISYAVDHSQLIKKSSFLFKITGRLTVLNFNNYYKHWVKKPVQLLADIRTNLSFVDSRFWGCEPSFIYGYLKSFELQLDDSKYVYFEHILAKAVLAAISKGYTFSAFPYSLRIKGVSGTRNKNYRHQLIYWLPKNWLKQLQYAWFNR